MAAPIGPGDWVECIDAAQPSKVGTIWLCEGINPAPESCYRNHGPCAGIRLVGVDCGVNGFALCAFRPIYRPSASLFLELLMDVPAAPERERV